MNNETKNEIGKGIATGASSITGAIAGAAIGAAVIPNKAEAHTTESQEVETEKVEIKVEVVTTEENPQHTTSSASTPSYTPHTTHQQVAETYHQPQPHVSSTNYEIHNEQVKETEPEVEVVGYERMTYEDGSQMDVAVMKVNGVELDIIDCDLDGQADFIMCDENQNGELDPGEVQNVMGQGIDMQPFADEAGFNPLYAQNDLPDYVNDADVDTYLA